MKRVLAALALALASCIPAAAQAPTRADFNWGYTYTASYPVACTATVTVNCIQNFTLSEGSTVIATVPATSATTYFYTLSTLPSVGSHTYTLIAIGAYQGGTINSLPATVSLQVPGAPATPATFTVVLH